MTRPFLDGQNVYLRSLEKSDFNEEYFDWFTDPEVTRFLGTGRFPMPKARGAVRGEGQGGMSPRIQHLLTSVSDNIKEIRASASDIKEMRTLASDIKEIRRLVSADDVKEIRLASASDLRLAIVEKSSDKHIGNIALSNLNWIDRVAELQTVIGDKDFWGKGCGTESKSLIIGYAFNQLGLRKIDSVHVTDNVASIKGNQRLGFQQEGVLRNEVLVDGEYRDVIRLGLFREEFVPFQSSAQRGVSDTPADSPSERRECTCGHVCIE